MFTTNEGRRYGREQRKSFALFLRGTFIFIFEAPEAIIIFVLLTCAAFNSRVTLGN
jgi:hypothetical protein